MFVVTGLCLFWKDHLLFLVGEFLCLWSDSFHRYGWLVEKSCAWLLASDRILNRARENEPSKAGSTAHFWWFERFYCWVPAPNPSQSYRVSVGKKQLAAEQWSLGGLVWWILGKYFLSLVFGYQSFWYQDISGRYINISVAYPHGVGNWFCQGGYDIVLRLLVLTWVVFRSFDALIPCLPAEVQHLRQNFNSKTNHLFWVKPSNNQDMCVKTCLYIVYISILINIFIDLKRCDKQYMCVFGPPVFAWLTSRWSRPEPKVSKPGKLSRSICCEKIAQPNKGGSNISWESQGVPTCLMFGLISPGRVSRHRGGEAPFRFACEISDFYQIDWQEAGTIEFGVPCLVYRTDFK